MRPKLAILISGGGRSLQGFIDANAEGRLQADIALVISSQANAAGIHRAHRANIATQVISRRDYSGTAEYSTAMADAIQEAGPVDLVIMAGFTCLWLIPDQLHYKVLNIHPALLPSFGGKGYYGSRVHEAVIESGAKVSGCTVHFADDSYDTGPIILQRSVPVLEEDTAVDLAARVFEAEQQAYLEAVQLFLADRLRLEGKRVRILPPSSDSGGP